MLGTYKNDGFGSQWYATNACSGHPQQRSHQRRGGGAINSEADSKAQNPKASLVTNLETHMEP